MSASYQLFRDLSPAIEAALRASIDRFGVLVPVVKDQHGNILDGYQRSRIAESLGLRYPVNIIEVADEAEALEIARTLNEDRRAMPKEERLPVEQHLREEGHSLRAIAGVVGVSKAQVRKDLAGVHQCTPARVTGVDGKSYPSRREPKLPVEDAIRQGRAALQELRQEREQAMADGMTTPDAPTGRYRCLVIDPPWPIEKLIRVADPNDLTFDYPSMTLDEIAALPIADLADESGCHVYLWTTHKHLPDALALFDCWGVRYQCLMTWVKNLGFTPYSWMYSTEHVLFGRVGSLALLRQGLRLDFSAARREHSRKPDEFYELVRLASPAPRLEMFAREARDGFTPWGNETGRFDEREVAS